MPHAEKELLDILREYIIDLSVHFSDKEISTLVAEFPSLAIYCHQHDDIFYNSSDDIKSSANIGFRLVDSDFITPMSLIDLCVKMSDCKPNSRVYLPFAGSCSFALYQTKPCEYDADEINMYVWAYSKILLLSQGIKANIKCGDCLIRTGDKNISTNKYDYIFSFPPMMGRREERDVANTFSELVKNSLNDNGEMYCILPLSFCFGKEWFDFRKSFFKDNEGIYSSVIISLPALLQPYSSVSMILLCLKKDGKGQICLMDATDEAFTAIKDLAGWKQKTLKSDSIIESIVKQDEKYVWSGNYETISEEVNLLPSRYLIKNILPKAGIGEKLFKLEELVSVVPFDRTQNTVDIPVIGMKELSSSYLNCDIYRKELPLSNKKEYWILTTDCLVVGFIGGKFKVGKLHGVSKNAPVALRHEVIAILKKSSNITEEYLLRCVMSPETELQARKMAVGVTISRINQQDVLSINILVPEEISQQESMCKEDTRISLTESDRQLLETAESFRQDIHMKKHAIGQTIFNLNNWMRVLQRARREGNGVVDDNATVGTVHKTKVADIYSNLQSIMQELQIKINKLDSGYGMQCSEIPLVEFMENYIRKNPNPIFQYVFDAIPHRASQNISDEEENQVLGIGDALECVKFPIEALTIIFDNIINNACSHGFENTANQKNMVKFEIESEGENYVVTISNNGKQLSDGYSTENVLTYGVSSKEGKGHYGIGGYEVRKLMREFNGEAEIISNPNNEFTVSYRLIFRNTNIVASF